MALRITPELKALLLEFLDTPKNSRMSQGELAKKHHLPPYTVSRWLKQLRKERREARKKTSHRTAPEADQLTHPSTNSGVKVSNGQGVKQLQDGEAREGLHGSKNLERVGTNDTEHLKRTLQEALDNNAKLTEELNAVRAANETPTATELKSQRTEVVSQATPPPTGEQAENLTAMAKRLADSSYQPTDEERAKQVIETAAKNENDKNLSAMTHRIYLDVHNMGVELYMKYWPKARAENFDTVDEYIHSALDSYNTLSRMFGSTAEGISAALAFRTMQTYAIAQFLTGKEVSPTQLLVLLLDPEGKEFA